jgi:hypothetical protein
VTRPLLANLLLRKDPLGEDCVSGYLILRNSTTSEPCPQGASYDPFPSRGAIGTRGNRKLTATAARAMAATAWKMLSMPPCSATDRLRTSACGRKERSGPRSWSAAPAQDPHGQRAPDRPAEHRARGGHAPPLPRHARLHRDDQRGVGEAQAQSIKKHGGPDRPQVRPGPQQERQPRRRAEGERKAAPDEPPVPGPRQDAPREVRREGPPDGDRRDGGAGVGGGAAEDALHVEGDERHHGDHRGPHQRPDRRGDGHDALREEVQRDQGLVGAAFRLDKEEEGDRGRRQEGEAFPAGAPAQEQEHDRDGKQHRAGEVQPVVATLHRFVVVEGEHGGAPQSHRDVHVEDPPPGEPVHDGAAEHRPDQARNAPDRAEDPLDPRPLVHVEEVSHDGDGDGLDGAGAQTLDRPEEDEHVHAPGVPAEEGPAEEQGDPREHHRFAAVQVGQLAVDGQGHGRREHVGREHPGVKVNPAQVPHRRGHRRGDHGHLHGGEEQAQEQGDDGQGAVGLARQVAENSGEPPMSCAASVASSSRRAGSRAWSHRRGIPGSP